MKYFLTYNDNNNNDNDNNHQESIIKRTTMTNRTALFQKSTRKNQEFERYLCDGQEAAILDATTSKYIPLSYFVTPQTTATTATSTATTTASTPRRTSSRNTHGIADKMPYESFRLIKVAPLPPTLNKSQSLNVTGSIHKAKSASFTQAIPQKKKKKTAMNPEPFTMSLNTTSRQSHRKSA